MKNLMIAGTIKSEYQKIKIDSAKAQEIGSWLKSNKLNPTVAIGRVFKSKLIK
jgi:hypothetical protein